MILNNPAFNEPEDEHNPYKHKNEKQEKLKKSKDHKSLKAKSVSRTYQYKIVEKDKKRIDLLLEKVLNNEGNSLSKINKKNNENMNTNRNKI
jgi:hypothetical protein